jgi:hypothetical protein
MIPSSSPPAGRFVHVYEAPSFVPHTARIVDLVAKSRLPALYGMKTYVQAEGLMSYEPDHRASQRRAGIMVGKSLRGSGRPTYPQSLR